METEVVTDRSRMLRNLPIRAMFLILFIIPFTRFDEFVDHIGSHFTGGAIDNVIRDNWYVVVLNIVIFLTFLIPLKFRRKIDWKEYGLVTAFFVSLFVEMYGIPLTILFASRYYGGEQTDLPDAMVRFSILGVDFSMTSAMVYGLFLMTIGTAIIILAWVTLYRNIGPSGAEIKVTGPHSLVTTGIYAHSRHPQYLGFILVILGWLIGWPTILVMVFAPILVFVYVRVCFIEEKELEENTRYQEYRKQVPFFI
jgi:methanethiol S-methyltransferase